jgi:L-threonylcarbamoyladenylate synthase
MNSQLDVSLQQQINRAVTILKNGGIVAFPTDTVYGLGASMTDIPAIKKVFEVKGRPEGMAMPVLVSDREQIKPLVSSIPPSAWLLMYNFFPGALSLIFNKSNNVPDIVTGGSKTVAIRIPDHPVPISIIQGLGQPIVGTSANLSGQPSALNAFEVTRQIGNKVDMIIDGDCLVGIESTVVDLSGKKPVIRRLGAVGLEQLQKTCPDIELAKEITNAHRNRQRPQRTPTKNQG